MPSTQGTHGKVGTYKEDRKEARHISQDPPIASPEGQSIASSSNLKIVKGGEVTQGIEKHSF